MISDGVATGENGDGADARRTGSDAGRSPFTQGEGNNALTGEETAQPPSAAELAIPLSEKQLTALEALSLGKSEAVAARLSGVAKSTVNRWVNCDANFQAALNARKLEQRRQANTRMTSLLEKAIGVIEEALDNGDLRAAKVVLDSQGALKPEPVGGTSSEVVAEQMELARHQEQVNLESRRDAIMQQDFDNVSRKHDRKTTCMISTRQVDLNRFVKKLKSDKDSAST